MENTWKMKWELGYLRLFCRRVIAIYNVMGRIIQSQPEKTIGK